MEVQKRQILWTRTISHLMFIPHCLKGAIFEIWAEFKFKTLKKKKHNELQLSAEFEETSVLTLCCSGFVRSS